jgi:hypothetical protein
METAVSLPPSHTFPNSYRSGSVSSRRLVAPQSINGWYLLPVCLLKISSEELIGFFRAFGTTTATQLKNHLDGKSALTPDQALFPRLAAAPERC